MSDSDLRSLREELEIRVVALLTGELSEADADELEQILTVDAELSAYRDRMAVLIGHVHDARDEIAPPVATEGMRLSPERRAEIFQEVDASEFEPMVEPKRVSWKMRVFEIAAVFAVLFILAGILIPTVGAVRKKAQKVAYQHDAHFEAPVVMPEMGPPASMPESKDTYYFSSQTEIHAERIEGMPQRNLSLPKPTAPMPIPIVEEVAELEMAGSFDKNSSRGIGAGLGQLDGNLRDDVAMNSSDLKSQRMRESKVDKISLNAPSVAYGYMQTDSLKKVKKRQNFEHKEVGSEYVGKGFSSMDGEDALLAMGGGNLELTGGSGAVVPYVDYDASGPVDPFAAPSAGVSGKLEATKLEGMMDAFPVPSTGAYAVRRSKSNADPFAAPATVAEKSAELLTRGRAQYLYGYFDGADATFAEVEYQDPANREAQLFQRRIGQVTAELEESQKYKTRQQMLMEVNHSYEVTDSGIRVHPRVAVAAAPKNPKATLTPKAEKQTTDEPISTFSLNVSDVSFKLAQAALESSRVPDASLIRSEEFVNSFDYRDPVPQGDEAVSLNWEIADLPYAHGRQVIRFSLQTQAAGRMEAQPLNLHLLVDNSGSMQRPDRRVILEQSLQSLKDKLQPQDELSIVLFARQPKLIANASTHASQQVAVDQALAYRPEGGTNLEAGLSAAYENAQRNFDPAASNRVILMTDGAANLGDVDGSALADMVVEQRKQGIALDAFGIGWDDYNDALLEEITRNGDGRYGFLNSPEDASQDFSEKLAGSLRVAAADVKVQVIWNPQRVTTYRQVGYDLHQLKTEDFRDNTVDAAEIGEAEAGTALYVVQVNDDPNVVGSLGTLQVRYRDPSTGLYHEQKWPLEMPRSIPSLEAASPALRLATTSALFAERLADNPYARGYRLSELTALTNDLPEAFPTQQRVVDLQNMINNARVLLGEN